MPETIRLRLIPESATVGRPVMAPVGDAIIKGDPGPQHLCGLCGRLLVDGTPSPKVPVIGPDGNPPVIKCTCGAFNEMLPI